jgi:hypothetical protein
MGVTRNADKTVSGKLERRRPCGRPRLRWKGNITMDVKYMRCECVCWILMAWSRNQWWALVNTIINEELGFPDCDVL